MTEVLIKRLSKNIELPKYETNGSSGMDLSANIEKQIKIEPGKTSIIPTGISVSMPKILKFKLDQGRDWLPKVRYQFLIHLGQ